MSARPTRKKIGNKKDDDERKEKSASKSWDRQKNCHETDVNDGQKKTQVKKNKEEQLAIFENTAVLFGQKVPCNSISRLFPS